MNKVPYEIRVNQGTGENGQPFNWYQLRLVFDSENDMLIKVTRDQANQIRLMEQIAVLKSQQK